MSGSLCGPVATLIDGRRSEDEIAECLADRYDPTNIRYVLAFMQQKGYVVSSRAARSIRNAAYWCANRRDLDWVRHRLSTTKVSVTTLGNYDFPVLGDILAELGVQLSQDAALNVILVDDYLSPLLKVINEEAMRTHRPWMLVKPVGLEAWIGPIFQPGKTGCWQCLGDRLRMHREAELFIGTRPAIREMAKPDTCGSPATVQAALSMTADIIARWIVSPDSSEEEGRIISVDSRNWLIRRHTVIRRPQCPLCGELAQPTEEDICFSQLTPRRLVDSFETYDRAVGPEETYQRYENLISPITGIVRSIDRVFSPNESIHVYLADHNFAYGSESLSTLKTTGRLMVAGKGLSDGQAKASCLCEVIERHSGFLQGNESVLMAPFSECDPTSTIHPNDCMLFSERQYRLRRMLNARGSRFNLVPEPFDESAVVRWSPIRSLTHGRVKYLPTQFLYYKANNKGGFGEPFWCQACSNGCAAGHTPEEALLHGLFELIERDAVALWWYNRLRRPGLRLSSFNDQSFDRIIDYHATLARRVWVLDISGDLDVPTFVALSGHIDREQNRIIFGFGCNLDARKAIKQALAEMNLFLYAVLRAFGGQEQVKPGFNDIEAEAWWQTATLENQPYLAPLPCLPMKESIDYPSQTKNETSTAIRFCREALEKQGMEVLVLDQTRPDIGLNVIKVVVPGLRHFWARFGPGRLYEVPVKMGWLSEARQETELNPFSIFI